MSRQQNSIPPREDFTAPLSCESEVPGVPHRHDETSVDARIVPQRKSTSELLYQRTLAPRPSMRLHRSSGSGGAVVPPRMNIDSTEMDVEPSTMGASSSKVDTAPPPRMPPRSDLEKIQVHSHGDFQSASTSIPYSTQTIVEPTHTLADPTPTIVEPTDIPVQSDDSPPPEPDALHHTPDLSSWDDDEYDIERVLVCQRYIREFLTRVGAKAAQDRKQLRRRTAEEILSKERSYVAALDTMVEHFLEPMRDMLKKQELSMIFSNVEQILVINRQFLLALEKRMENWDTYDGMGDVFNTLVPWLTLYSEYCSNQHNATAYLFAKRGKSDRFAAFLENTSKNLHGVGLNSFLIKPIQRIPNYQLLLRRLLKYTDPENPDHIVLAEALAGIDVVADLVEQNISERQNIEHLVRLSKKLSGNVPVDLIQPSRCLLHEGSLTKLCRKIPKKRYCFLFNDSLMYGEELTVGPLEVRYRIHRTINLSQGGRLDPAPDNPDAGIFNAFTLTSSTKSFLLWADSPESKNVWLNAIHRGRIMLGQIEDVETAPFWMQDKSSDHCLLCAAKFKSVSRRRHHCRKCGRLVCDACSSSRLKLPTTDTRVRVCDDCYELLTGDIRPLTKLKKGPTRPTSMFFG